MTERDRRPVPPGSREAREAVARFLSDLVVEPVTDPGDGGDPAPEADGRNAGPDGGHATQTDKETA